MKLRPPFRADGEHLAVELPGSKAIFTTRRGGFSSGPYDSLNLGRSTNDDPGAVQRNRELVERWIGAPLLGAMQVHGTRVAHVSRAPGRGEEPFEADGLVTSVTGLAPMVLTADCLPITVGAAGAVAMLHAGWRGLAAGVLEEGVAALRALGAQEPFVAAIGPGAGACCYEVGEDVHRFFASYGPTARHARHLDLKAVAHAALQRAGVNDVHDIGLCTICADPALFYSHRRDRGVTGRQAGIAWLT